MLKMWHPSSIAVEVLDVSIISQHFHQVERNSLCGDAYAPADERRCYLSYGFALNSKPKVLLYALIEIKYSFLVFMCQVPLCWWVNVNINSDLFLFLLFNYFQSFYAYWSWRDSRNTKEWIKSIFLILPHETIHTSMTQGH